MCWVYFVKLLSGWELCRYYESCGIISLTDVCTMTCFVSLFVLYRNIRWQKRSGIFPLSPVTQLLKGSCFKLNHTCVLIWDIWFHSSLQTFENVVSCFSFPCFVHILLIVLCNTASPAAPCAPWTQTHPWADTWCRSCPCTGKDWWERTWSSYCTLSRERGIMSVRLDNQSSVFCWDDQGRISDSSEDTTPDYWDAHCASSTGSWIICHSNDALLWPSHPL